MLDYVAYSRILLWHLMNNVRLCFLPSTETRRTGADAGVVAAAVVVPTLVIVLVVLGVVFLVLRWKQVFPQKPEPPQQSKEPPAPEEVVSMSIVDRNCTAGNVAAKEQQRHIADLGQVDKNATINIRDLQYLPNNDLWKNEPPGEIVLPTENPRDSFIESMHELPRQREVAQVNLKGNELIFSKENLQSEDVIV